MAGEVIYLSGAKNVTIAHDLATGTMGFLQTPRSRHRLDGVAVWALDNGCYTNAYPGDDAYLALLDKWEPHRERCLFVTAPDVVADAAATLAQYEPMAERIRAKGWPVALVGQDGMESMHVPWDLVDWVFIGGSTEWKLGEGARKFIRTAQSHGKRVHVGRVNSGVRYAVFAGLGCDTADGTFIAYGPEVNAPKVRAWMQRAIQMELT